MHTADANLFFCTPDAGGGKIQLAANLLALLNG